MAAPIRVMVVEDSAFMRKALARRIDLDPRFKVVETAENGKEAIEKAIRIKPDVITLDVEMPVMNGIEALKVIVSQTSIPVVMVSAVTDVGAKVTLEALEIGAVDFIPKSKGAELIHEKLIAAFNSNVRARVSKPVARFTGAAKPVLGSEAVRPTEDSRRVSARILVIGSSTGGPQALQQVVSELPANLPVPVVVAQHMPPQFTAALARRLDESSPLKVIEAQHGTPLLRGNVYIAPGGQHLRVTQTGLQVAGDRGESIYRPSVDVLAESARITFGKQVLGVMLTGMGNDGTKEFVRLRQGGGYNIAQDQASCVVYGMPRSLVEANGADEVLALSRIGQRIRSLLAC